MKKRRPAAEVLFPQVRAKVFALLFGPSAREHYVRELALRSRLTLHTIQDELRKLSALGLVISRSNGFHRYYAANRRHPLYPAVRQIVALSSQLPGAQVRDLHRTARKPSLRRREKPRRAHIKGPHQPTNWGTSKGVLTA